MEAPTLPKIRLKKSAKSLFVEKHLVKLIVEEVKKFPDYTELKFDNRVVEIVLENLINALPSKPSKSRPIDIAKVALEILKQIFSLSQAEEIKIVEKQIEYFCQNNIVTRKTLIGSIIEFGFSFLKKR
jgi:hypothetical protein